MKKLKLGGILNIVAIALVILSLICFAGAGLQKIEGDVSTTIGLGAVMFGGGKVVTEAKGMGTMEIEYKGALSIFALIGFILVIVALILLVIGLIKKNNLFVIIGAGLLIVGAICLFMTKVAGTNITEAEGEKIPEKFQPKWEDTVKDLDLGAGVIAMAVMNLLAGLTAAASWVLNRNSK